MHYVVLDVFSKVDSTHFQDRAGATAVCWVREEVADKSGTVEGVATSHVSLVWDPPWTKERMSEDALLELGML